jgi:hypothetical protein
MIYSYIPSFKKIVSGIEEFIRGIHRQHGDIISVLLMYFKIRKSRIKRIE